MARTQPKRKPRGGGKAGALSAPRTAGDDAAEGGGHQVGLRVPDGLLRRVDAYLDKLRRELPGLAVSRSDALRILVAKALDAEGIEGE